MSANHSSSERGSFGPYPTNKLLDRIGQNYQLLEEELEKLELRLADDSPALTTAADELRTTKPK